MFPPTPFSASGHRPAQPPIKNPGLKEPGRTSSFFLFELRGLRRFWKYKRIMADGGGCLKKEALWTQYLVIFFCRGSSSPAEIVYFCVTKLIEYNVEWKMVHFIVNKDNQSGSSFSRGAWFDENVDAHVENFSFGCRHITMMSFWFCGREWARQLISN